ncbi:MAG: hypothetical protein HYX76_05050 [Acidobacteria bacterium]|nr:hypothetical protein [Acidobacteriota bacterium]
MYLIREVMHCKPGKAGDLVRRFKEIGGVMAEMGFTERSRILTDMSGERFWTVVSEQAVDKLEDYLNLTRQTMTDPRVQKIMQGYHDSVDWGTREIYKIEQ